MVDRGQCHFVVKAQHIQQYGGALAIVADNKPGEHADHIVMADDGKGAGVSIPTFLIGQADGQTIKDAIHKEAPEGAARSERWRNMVILQADINMMSKTDKPVRVDLWYSSAAELLRSGLNFEDYARMQDIFDDQVVF